MMGQQRRAESLFYYFRLEEQIPSDHLLRMIDGHVDFSFVREQLKNFYSSTGGPSIDPEILLRLLLVGYLYGITSERRLMDEVRMHLAYRWFTRLGFDQEIPDHSTFSKNRHGRFRQSGVFRKVFEEIVRRCLEAGLVEGRNVAVDGTLVGANASQQSRVPKERLVEVAKLRRTVQAYLSELASRRLLRESMAVGINSPNVRNSSVAIGVGIRRSSASQARFVYLCQRNNAGSSQPIHANPAAARSHPTLHVLYKVQGAYLCLFKSACTSWF